MESVSQLITIKNEFNNFKFYKGTAKLALQFAHNIDPTGITNYSLFLKKNKHPLSDLDSALMWKKSNPGAEDHPLYQLRLHAYGIVIDIFNQLDLASKGILSREELEKLKQDKKDLVAIVLESQDELFHYCLYKWYMDKNYESELLHVTQKKKHFLSFIKLFCKAWISFCGKLPERPKFI